MAKSKFDKECIVCHSHYKYCGGCGDYSNKPRWMQSFHDDNCHKIFNTVMEYRTGAKTPAECAEIMRGLDLSYRDKIDPDFNAFITAILADGADKPAEEVAIDQVAVEDAVVQILAEEPVEENPEEKIEEKEEVSAPEGKQDKFKNYKKTSYKRK